jgi:hypothetical protein
MAERPNKTPPVSGIRYAFISSKLSIKDHLLRSMIAGEERNASSIAKQFSGAGARDRDQEGAGL